MKNINISIGGVTKESLFQRLNEHDIMINPLGEKLLRSELFQVSTERQHILLTEISLNELGFKDGANLLEIIKAAHKIGLTVCPVDVALFLRLDYKQKNTYGMEKKFKTPEGAVTVISEILNEEATFPKGFYLRKIEGQLWLRGYLCDYEHIFEADETFIFKGQVKD